MTSARQPDGNNTRHLTAMGARLRALRQSRGLTLQRLAELTGLSTSMISLVERGRASPSIGSLVAISSALHVPVKDFFDFDDDEDGDIVIRVQDQPVISPQKGVERRLVKTDRANNIEVSINEYEPNLEREPAPARHSGYEYGVVLDGELTVELAGQSYVLKRGDAISYPSSELHLLYNGGNVRTRALWINIGGLRTILP